MKEYAVYKGEDILAMGTIKEIAEELKIKEDSVTEWGVTINGKTYDKILEYKLEKNQLWAEGSGRSYGDGS